MRCQRLFVLALVCCSAVTAGYVGPVAGGATDPSGATPNGSTATPPSVDGQTTQPTVHAIYPDPVRSGDRGEFVVLALPNDTSLDHFAITDGQTSASLPNLTVSGRVALTDAPAIVRNLTEYPVIGLDSAPQLANGGDSVILVRNGTTVASVRYSDTEEGSLGRVVGSTLRWRPLGATERPVVTGGPDTVRAFTLPDAPDAPLAPIRNATSRVYLAGYTLSSDRVADALLAAQRRGAEVRVLLEGAPIGGRSRVEATTLDRLSGAGVEIRVVAGPRARYRYHHAKYAIADDRAVVLTENWKPAGTGGKSSRGWGVSTGQSRVVAGLAATFRADIGWRDAVAWTEYRDGRSFQRGETADGSYPSNFGVTTVPVERTELLVTPDNAQTALVEELDAATESIDVIQPTVGGWDEPLMRALRRAAKRDVEVRLLLSSAWYAREDNQKTVDRFEAWADRTDASLSASLADPGDRYAKIHAKGAVVDGDRVIVGSLNWNEQAATVNREVILVLYGRAAADYFGRVFERDWNGGASGVPLGIVAAVLGALVVAGIAARRVRFRN
jgi:phosphatidylserine/phosphatidylglycerophosphate/cardiolipin synthase-like enzyme